jgi:hypothetical protein
MDDRLSACEDEDLLMERLVQVENALFCLKVRSSCVDSWDEKGEVERLEKIRRELHESYARAYRPPPERLSSPDMAASASG